jgi:hypothetical protein
MRTDSTTSFLHLVDFNIGYDTNRIRATLSGAAVSGIKCALPAIGGLY